MERSVCCQRDLGLLPADEVSCLRRKTNRSHHLQDIKDQGSGTDAIPSPVSYL